MNFNIQRQGRKWSRAEIAQKYHNLCPEKIELIKGKMFWSDEQRLNMLALLLENVGMDAAVKLGDPALWKQAIDETLEGAEMTKARTLSKATATEATNEKTCTKCKQQKNETDFPFTKIRGRMLRRSWCDSCMKEYYKAYALAKAKK